MFARAAGGTFPLKECHAGPWRGPQRGGPTGEATARWLCRYKYPDWPEFDVVHNKIKHSDDIFLFMRLFCLAPRWGGWGRHTAVMWHRTRVQQPKALNRAATGSQSIKWSISRTSAAQYFHYYTYLTSERSLEREKLQGNKCGTQKAVVTSCGLNSVCFQMAFYLHVVANELIWWALTAFLTLTLATRGHCLRLPCDTTLL